MSDTHYCVKHQTVWFKKGKMKRYAHPIKDESGEDTSEWCNEPKSEGASKAPEPSRSGSTNDSIESQVAFKGMVELWIADKLGDKAKETTVNWAMARIDLPGVIVTKIEEAKSEKTTKTTSKSKTTDQPEDKERTSGSPSGEALELLPGESERVKGFLAQLTQHGKKDPRLFLEVEYGIPQDEALTEKRCETLYKTINKKGW